MLECNILMCMLIMLVSTIGIIKITLILVILLTTVVKSGNVDDKSLVFANLKVDPEVINVPTTVDGLVLRGLVQSPYEKLTSL